MLFSEVDLALVATVNVIQFHVNEGGRHVWADRDQSLILNNPIFDFFLHLSTILYL